MAGRAPGLNLQEYKTGGSGDQEEIKSAVGEGQQGVGRRKKGSRIISSSRAGW